MFVHIYYRSQLFTTQCSIGRINPTLKNSILFAQQLNPCRNDHSFQSRHNFVAGQSLPPVRGNVCLCSFHKGSDGTIVPFGLSPFTLPTSTIPKCVVIVIPAGAFKGFCHFVPHCSAIALAIPWKVRLRSFQRSLPPFMNHVPALWQLTSGLTSLVGTILGKFLSHSRVFFCTGCPCSKGWIYCVAGGISNILLDIGFSMAICAISALANFMKNSFASSPFWYRSWLRTSPLNKCFAPAFD